MATPSANASANTAQLPHPELQQSQRLDDFRLPRGEMDLYIEWITSKQFIYPGAFELVLDVLLSANIFPPRPSPRLLARIVRIPEEQVQRFLRFTERLELRAQRRRLRWIMEELKEAQEVLQAEHDDYEALGGFNDAHLPP